MPQDAKRRGALSASPSRNTFLPTSRAYTHTRGCSASVGAGWCIRLPPHGQQGPCHLQKGGVGYAPRPSTPSRGASRVRPRTLSPPAWPTRGRRARWTLCARCLTTPWPVLVPSAAAACVTWWSGALELWFRGSLSSAYAQGLSQRGVCAFKRCTLLTSCCSCPTMESHAESTGAAITIDAVREQLTLLGHSDVPDDVIAQFLAELQLEPSTSVAAEPHPVYDADAAPSQTCVPHPPQRGEAQCWPWPSESAWTHAPPCVSPR